jgi:hypothetical protein
MLCAFLMIITPPLPGAVIFDGLFDSITVRNNFTEGLNGITVSVWVKGARPGNILTGSVILHYQNGCGFYLCSADRKASGYLSWEDVPSHDRWRHITATWSNKKLGDGKMRLYLNGVKQYAERDFSGGDTGVLAGGGSLRIGGAFNEWISGFKGRMEDFRIYNRPLASDEIFSIFTARGKDEITSGLVLRLNMVPPIEKPEAVRDISGNGHDGAMSKPQLLTGEEISCDKQLGKDIEQTLNEMERNRANCEKIIAGLEKTFSETSVKTDSLLPEFIKVKQQYLECRNGKIYMAREIYNSLLRLAPKVGQVE